MLINMYVAHLNWNWGGGKKDGRAELDPEHPNQVMKDIEELLHMLSSYLCLPCVTRARNLFSQEGKAELRAQIPVQQHFFYHIYTCCRRLSFKVEVVKELGLPANEASRINQYLEILIADIEKLHNLKQFRTPQGTRSMARIFIHLMPWLYGPYHVWVAKSVHKVEAGHTASLQGLLFSLALSVVMSCAMIGLFNVQRAMQDPFDTGGIDNVNAKVMCQEIANAIRIVRSDGARAWDEDTEDVEVRDSGGSGMGLTSVGYGLAPMTVP